METKKELRAIFKKRREAIENKEEKNALIVKRILAMPQVQRADALFIFYPLKNEINLLPVAEYAFENGKKVGFPLCEDKDGTMSFRLVSSLSELVDGSFGTKEPKDTAPIAEPKNTVIFLPALAIDASGYRLGYGKGYYDRYLEKYSELSPFTVGVIYDELIVKELPKDSFDVPCLAVVSEARQAP
jgi:5-formyltetrahydrofolate cyclo-ligase